MNAYYNEIDPYCCAWLSNLMDAGLITSGKIDDRSIAEVSPDDIRGYVRRILTAITRVPIRRCRRRSDTAREVTAKEAAELTGRSVTWLRTHECSWCGQSCLNALRYGCGAIYSKCDPKLHIFRCQPEGGK